APPLAPPTPRGRTRVGAPAVGKAFLRSPGGEFPDRLGKVSRSTCGPGENARSFPLVWRVLRRPSVSFLERGGLRVLSALAVAAAAGRARASTEAPLAPPVPARAMALDEALAYARAHQPSLQSALARVAAAAADRRIPRAQWLPGVGATLQAFEGTTNNSTASYLGAPRVDLPRIGGTPVKSTGSFEPSTSTLGAIGGGQEVFDFGRIAAQSAVVDVAFEAEQQGAHAERLRIDLVVKDAYFGVHGARAVLRAA